MKKARQDRIAEKEYLTLPEDAGESFFSPLGAWVFRVGWNLSCRKGEEGHSGSTTHVNSWRGAMQGEFSWVRWTACDLLVWGEGEMSRETLAEIYSWSPSYFMLKRVLALSCKVSLSLTLGSWEHVPRSSRRQKHSSLNNRYDNLHRYFPITKNLRYCGVDYNICITVQGAAWNVELAVEWLGLAIYLQPPRAGSFSPLPVRSTRGKTGKMACLRKAEYNSVMDLVQRQLCKSIREP